MNKYLLPAAKRQAVERLSGGDAWKGPRRENERLRAEVRHWMRQCDYWRDEAFRSSGFTPPAHLADEGDG